MLLNPFSSFYSTLFVITLHVLIEMKLIRFRIWINYSVKPILRKEVQLGFNGTEYASKYH